MALQSSGNPISLQDIEDEYGGSHPISLSEYYDKGNAPSAGNPIDLGADFYGTSNVTAATGGTVTTSGDYKIHTFTSSGNFVVSSVGTAVDFLIVAGGGGGGWSNGGVGGGGGGAGGYRNSYNNETSGGGGSSETASTLTSTGTYAVVVGAGGPSGANGSRGAGNQSTWNSMASTRGGGGGNATGAGDSGGQSGGSGGGGYGIGGFSVDQNKGGGTANQGYAGGGGGLNYMSNYPGGG